MKSGNVTYFYICYTFSIEATKFRLKHVQLCSLPHLALPSPPTATSSHPYLTATGTGRGHRQWDRHWGPQNCLWMLSAVPVWQQLSNEQERGVVQVRHGQTGLTATQWALHARLLPPGQLHALPRAGDTCKSQLPSRSVFVCLSKGIPEVWLHIGFCHIQRKREDFSRKGY